MAPTTLTLNSRSSALDILRYISALSSSITPTAIIGIVKNLDRTANTAKLGSIAAGACTNIRKVIKEVATTSNLAIPPALSVNNEINFSAMALMGHMIYALDDDALTPDARVTKEAYKASIGGYENLKAFARDGAIDGKEVRTKILRKWGGVLQNLDVTAYEKVFAEKFPHLVVTRYGLFAWIPGLRVLFSVFDPVYVLAGWINAFAFYPLIPFLIPFYAARAVASRTWKVLVIVMVTVSILNGLAGERVAKMEDMVMATTGVPIPLALSGIIGEAIVPAASWTYSATLSYYKALLGGAKILTMDETARATALDDLMDEVQAYRASIVDYASAVAPVAKRLSVVASAAIEVSKKAANSAAAAASGVTGTLGKAMSARLEEGASKESGTVLEKEADAGKEVPSAPDFAPSTIVNTVMEAGAETVLAEDPGTDTGVKPGTEDVFSFE